MASSAPALPSPPRVLLLTWQPISPGRPHLDEAVALREEGRLRAAAILARVAVETHLVAICRGRKVRCIADGVKILTGVRILTSREGRELLDRLAVGNHAAHGRHVTADAVDGMLATADELLGRWYIVPPSSAAYQKRKRVLTPLERDRRTAKRKLVRRRIATRKALEAMGLPRLQRAVDRLALVVTGDVTDALPPGLPAPTTSFAPGVPR